MEINNLECIWVEIKLSNSRNVLYGVFYRPPNSSAMYTSLLEDSIGLAVDTNITDIIIMGDFNLNIMDQSHYRKIYSICKHFSLTQCIEEPTHFTENSMSVIDLLFAKNRESILTSGVGELSLNLNVRYHCPIFGVLNFLKPKYKSYKRKIGSMNTVIIVSLEVVYRKLIGILFLMMIQIYTHKIFRTS